MAFSNAVSPRYEEEKSETPPEESTRQDSPEIELVKEELASGANSASLVVAEEPVHVEEAAPAAKEEKAVHRPKRARKIDDFTLEDIGKLIRDVEKLKLQLHFLEGELNAVAANRTDNAVKSGAGSITQEAVAEQPDETAEAVTSTPAEAQQLPSSSDSRDNTPERSRRESASKSGFGVREVDPELAARTLRLGRDVLDLQQSVFEIRDKMDKFQNELQSVARHFSERTLQSGSSGGVLPSPSMERRFPNLDVQQARSETLKNEIMEEIAQLRFEFEQRLLGLTPKSVTDLSLYAPLPVVKKIAVNFQENIEEIDQQIDAIKDFLKNLVSRNDLEAMMDKLKPRSEGEGSTAAGRMAIRCLLCGKPAGAVTGMILESDMARLLGTPPQCGVMRGRGSMADSYILTYGKDALKRENTKKGNSKKILPPINSVS
jgi:hypothetical protein